MENNRLAVTKLISEYHQFSKQFWLSYKTLEKLMPPERFNEIKMGLLKSKRIDPKLIEEVQNFEIERDLLDKEWTQKNEEAKATGTSTHEAIKNLFAIDSNFAKQTFSINNDYEVIQDNFLNTNKGIFNELKIEVPIDDYVLVGVIDLLIKDGNHLKIIDFKTDEQIKWRSMYDVGKKKSKRMLYPLSHLEDCSGIHYQIQLSLYAKMLQMLNPDFVIDQLQIIQIKDMKVKKAWTVEYLSQDIDKLIKWHIKNINIKKETEKCKPIVY